MKTKSFILAVIVTLYLQVAVSASQIIIEDADTIWDATSEYSSDLTSVTDNVTLRILLEYVNTIYRNELNLSTDLINVASGVMPRMLMEYANTIYRNDLSPSTDLINIAISVMPRILSEYSNSIYRNELDEIPIDFTTLIDGVPQKRLIIEYANTNYHKGLIFPKELINETTPPIISNVIITNITDNSATIEWDTDEIADSLVKYSKVSEIYTESEWDSLFVTSHRIVLSGLSSGTGYYFVINSTDQSGNSAEGLEYSFASTGAYTTSTTTTTTTTTTTEPTTTTISSNAVASFDWDGSNLIVEIESPVGVGMAQIKVDIPAELIVGDATTTGFMSGATHMSSDTEHRWFQLNANGNKTGSLIIPITCPGNGTYIVNLTEISIKDIDENNIVFDTEFPLIQHISTTTSTTTTTIQHPVTVTRVLPDGVSADSQLTVTLIMDVNESDIPETVGLTETPPEGWEVISTEPNGSLTSSPGSIQWLFWDMGAQVEDRNITYTLLVSPDANGTDYFSGSVDYGGVIKPPIYGDSQVLVVSCSLNGDYPPCGEVTLSEVIDFITIWSQGEVLLDDVIDLIIVWAG